MLRTQNFLQKITEKSYYNPTTSHNSKIFTLLKVKSVLFNGFRTNSVSGVVSGDCLITNCLQVDLKTIYSVVGFFDTYRLIQVVHKYLAMEKYIYTI